MGYSLEGIGRSGQNGPSDDESVYTSPFPDPEGLVVDVNSGIYAASNSTETTVPPALFEAPEGMVEMPETL